MENVIDLNAFIGRFDSARRSLVGRLTRDGVSRVNVWGTGLSGEVVSYLLAGTGIGIVNYYDSFRTGEFLGFPIKSPSGEMDSGIPVVVASTREPGRLGEVTRFLKTKKIPYYLLSLNSYSRLNVRDFKDRHRGERCFVIGNGPSLNKLDMGKLKDEITIGANRCFLGFDKWGFKVKYWTIEDKLVAEDVREEWNEFGGPVKFIPLDLQHLVTNYDKVCTINLKRESFGGGLPKFPGSYCEFFWGGTVTYIMLQLAAVMGCAPIYLIGVDFSYVKPGHVTEGEKKTEWTSHGDDPNHFDPVYFGKDRKWHDPMLPRMLQAFKSAKGYFDSRGITVLNATPGTKLDVFEKINFSSLF